MGTNWLCIVDSSSPDAKVERYRKDSNAIPVAPRNSCFTMSHVRNLALQIRKIWIRVLGKSNMSNVTRINNASKNSGSKLEKWLLVNENNVSISNVGDKVSESRATRKPTSYNQ